MNDFHPAVAAWFQRALGTPTGCQEKAWPAIRQRRHTLVAAPTGAGKTLAAFLCAIDELVKAGSAGTLADETYVVYVSPLRALSNDVQRNLQGPLNGIRDELLCQGLDDIDIRTFVRTGDTTAQARALMRRRPPHIVVTTPESLYILLTSDSGRAMLRSTRSVIVDEIHAIAASKRGAHLALSLERLAALCERPPVRIGLSATQQPINEVAGFLTGVDAAGVQAECTIIDLGHTRQRDLALEIPASPLTAVMSGEVWTEVYDRLAALAREHRTTLVFVNTRRMAERLARHLSERLGEDQVAAHHGSLSREQRFDAEQRLKAGRLRTMVATASLELGIDIGDVDLVCQIGSTRSISAFLQRAGRANHGVGGLPKARLFPLSRDELIEAIALLDAVHRGELDRIEIMPQPLDVLAQQLVAAVAMEEWEETELWDRTRRAWPYRSLSRRDFDAVLGVLAEGYAARRGRASAYLHRDVVNGRLRARRGARLTAVTCGGAIPDNADFEVREEPAGTFIGTVNEDFAFESMAGDIFQLGNTSWRILRVESGTVRVADAQGQPPTIPFWLGEAPARTHELSHAVSRLRLDIEREFDLQPERRPAERRLHACGWLCERTGIDRAAAAQAVDYLWLGRVALGRLPTQQTLILERFFDESGGMQLVLHSPFGGRLNRAWGLALRKRFCRQFNFELQAAATEDAIILSLGETHSFPLDDVWRFLHSASVRDVLTQALLDAPMFTVRWRWNTGVALAVPRFRGGRKVPPRLQRMFAEDLVAVVFPDQLACLENIVGRREIPDHPLVRQTLDDCLHEAMDIEALEQLLAAIERGEKTLLARDLTEPSPLAAEILNARPYAFLDDAPLEERRTQAVIGRRWLDADSADDLGKLDPAAIARVRAEVWSDARNADELHDALLWLGFMTAAEAAAGPGGEAGAPAADWVPMLAELGRQRRVGTLRLPNAAPVWVVAERLPEFAALFGAPAIKPRISAPAEAAGRQWTPESALVNLIRGRLQGVGPVTAASLAASLGLAEHAVEPALMALEQEGFVLRGRFDVSEGGAVEWCERRLLARIHRYTLNRLRNEIAPVSAATLAQFLCRWQHAVPASQLEGEAALEAVVQQLEGFAAPALAWERDLLPLRLRDFAPDMLDRLCLSGRYAWLRLAPSAGRNLVLKLTPISLVPRRRLGDWRRLAATTDMPVPLPASVQVILDALENGGPAFIEELIEATGRLPNQVEQALTVLVAAGRVHADSFASLRRLMYASDRQRHRMRHQRHEYGGRWVRLKPLPPAAAETEDETALARVLLNRYGVVFRKLLEREAGLPPWRRLLASLRRLEARGEVRGGRFVSGFAGEQFALPEAVAGLRELQRNPSEGELVTVSGADPLNLAGILMPGPRLPSLAANRMLYRDGQPLAYLKGKTVSFEARLDDREHWQLRNALIRQAGLRI